MSAPLDIGELTDWQFGLTRRAYAYPTILHGPTDKNVAHRLAEKGWGAVENGASGEVIFRLNQAGSDAVKPHIPHMLREA